jgi:hypothetical protein
MLKPLVASRFIRKMSVGRNAPVLLACQETEVIAKFSACECGAMGLIREALAAMLARDLGLAVPEPCAVDISAEFVESIPGDEGQVKRLIGASVSPAFGSSKLPNGYSLWTADRDVSDEMLEQAGEIFAFDALILNPDRIATNPNCQASAERFAIFDHELSLVTETVGTFLQPPPWQVGSLSQLAGGSAEHLLFRGIRTRNPTLQRLEESWRGLRPARIDEYGAALPATWLAKPESVTNALKYLKDVIDHLTECFQEVRRVLA